MNGTTHPLVARYLDDLARMLGDLDPGERAEVLAGVREHIDLALADAPEDDTAVSAVLTELGPPEAVARAAFADRGAPGGATNATRAPLTSRAWVPIVIAVIQSLSLLLMLLVVSASSAWVTEGTASSTGEITVTESWGGGSAAALAGGLMALPLWMVVAIVVGISGLWTAREKLAHLLVLPAATLLFAAGPEIGWAVGGTVGVAVAAWTALGVVVLGGGRLLYVLTSRARARARTS